jgi:hypothetical protein
MTAVRRLTTADAPGMVRFRPDGRYAFLPSRFTPECAVNDSEWTRREFLEISLKTGGAFGASAFALGGQP